LNDRRAIQLSLSAQDGADPGAGDPFDPVLHPQIYMGVLWRRVFAFLVDILVLSCLFALGTVAACVLAVFSFGLISLGALLAVPVFGVLYDCISIGSGRSATPGMRALGLRVWAIDGGKPDVWQALLASILFWVSVPATSFLVLFVAFFDSKSRLLHDLLSGTVVLRSD
jgi:uncharacterized RDD family membrane protein YckC